MAKTKQNKLPLTTQVSVKMTKKMEYGEYLKIFKQAKLKGWKIQASQI